MKLANSSDINKILENIDQEYVFDGMEDDIAPSPCYQMTVDSDREEFVFSVDSKEITSFPLKGFSLDYDELKGTLATCFDCLRGSDVRGLKRFLKKVLK